jgi:hypothetical protein
VDTSTISSLAKWPNVPFCYGWLFLDRKGLFRIRSEYAQNNNLPGEVIKHLGLIDAIKKHICLDDQGQYFYQNGPQRVYLSLAYCPYVVRLLPHKEHGWILQNNIDQEIKPTRCFLDEIGNILLECFVSVNQCSQELPVIFTEIEHRTVALLHDHDLNIFSELSQMDVSSCGIKGIFKWHQIEIPIEPIMGKDIASDFHFKAIPIAP